VKIEDPLWRAIAIFRVVALGYAAILIAHNYPTYRNPLGGWAVLAVMAVWTVVAIQIFRDPARRRWPYLAADLIVSVLCLLSTGLVETHANLADGHGNLSSSWVAAPVLAWAVQGGKRWGITAALLISVADFGLRGFYAGHLSQSTFNGTVLLLMAGVVVGHMVKLARVSETRLAHAIALETTTRERERLARDIHDSVLQVLALVQRRGGELGGEAAELGRLAGDQEAALRSLIGTPAASVEPGEADLRALLSPYASSSVSVAAPATPVRLPGRTAHELAASVAAALDNVARHCGPDAKAWVLLEQDEGTVTVSVRDDGPGIAASRLAEAASAGRLGVAQSIQGRVRDLGGTVTIHSAPGEGTEIEMTVPA
jgi:signal transduction histidine kinase